MLVYQRVRWLETTKQGRQGVRGWTAWDLGRLLHRGGVRQIISPLDSTHGSTKENDGGFVRTLGLNMFYNTCFTQEIMNNYDDSIFRHTYMILPLVAFPYGEFGRARKFVRTRVAHIWCLPLTAGECATFAFWIAMNGNIFLHRLK